MYTLSNALTLLRILLTPFLVLSIIQGRWSLALVIFMCAAITDFLDGYLARLWKQETTLGAYLDPLADKIMILSCYTALAAGSALRDFVPAWFLVVIVCKEMLIMAGALYWGAWSRLVNVKARFLGKLAMFMQLAFLGLLLVHAALHWSMVWLYPLSWVVFGTVMCALVDYAALIWRSNVMCAVLLVGLLTGGVYTLLAQPEENFFVIDVTTISQKGLKEKKYSELCDELLALHEEWLHAASSAISELSAQIKVLAKQQIEHLDAVRKVAENRPQASREHIIKEISRVQASLDAL